MTKIEFDIPDELLDDFSEYTMDWLENKGSAYRMLISGESGYEKSSSIADFTYTKS